MAFLMIFWATYIPFIILLLSLVGRYAMRALARLLGRRRIANACQSATGIRLRQLPIAPDKPRLTRPAAHITILAVAALTPACRCHFITPRHAQHGSREHAAGSRLVRGSASPPRPGFGQSKAIRTSSALR